MCFISSPDVFACGTAGSSRRRHARLFPPPEMAETGVAPALEGRRADAVSGDSTAA